MVQYKSNSTKNVGIRPVGTGGVSHTIVSIDIPEQCDEIRFQYFGNTSKNVPFYSFADRYNVATFTGDSSRVNLDYWTIPYTDSSGNLPRFDGSFGYGEIVVIRNPTSFGKTIYFSHLQIGDNTGVFGVQYQIIGGCNNGY